MMMFLEVIIKQSRSIAGFHYRFPLSLLCLNMMEEPSISQDPLL